MDYIQNIKAPIERELEKFTLQYQSVLQCSNPAVDVLLKFLLERKGKFMRPILVLLTAKCFGEIPESVYHSAISFELIHQASLIHDDVVDESDKRRGMVSANAAFDNKLAVLLGDFVVSKALIECAATDSVHAVRTLSTLIGNLSEGEITQLDALNGEALSEELYFDIITKKTAALFSTSAELSALLCGATPEQTAAFSDFGRIAGLCFQIRDDIFDYQSDASIGKPTGNDLKEGKFTLPAIYAINNSDKDWSEHIHAIRSLNATPEQIAQVTDFVVSNGGISYAEQKMKELRDQALSALPESIPAELKLAFSSYLDLIINRSK